MKLPYDGINIEVISPTFGLGKVAYCKCSNCWNPDRCVSCYPFLVDFGREEVRSFDEFGRDQFNGEVLRFNSIPFHKIWKFYR